MSEIREKEFSQENSMTRRKLLGTVGYAGTAVLVMGGLNDKARAAFSKGVYPQVKIANLRDLHMRRPVKFDYPLTGRKNILMDLGCVVEGGVGPNRSIVAYSMFCTHLGCSVDLEWETGALVCECHQTRYDPALSGRVIEGPAPTHLPMVSLDIDKATGDIYAVGIAGLIYGLRNNLLDGEILKD